MPPPSDALAGISVLDLTRNFAGPYCSMLLADLGADVIKVESPGAGDDTRQWRPPEWNGQSATFLAGNRGKRSIAIDLDSEAGQEVVRRLAAKADIVISSFRPGSLEKRGLDYESLRSEQPRPDLLLHHRLRVAGARSATGPGTTPSSRPRAA